MLPRSPAAAADLKNASTVSINYKNGNTNFPAALVLPVDFAAAADYGDFNCEPGSSPWHAAAGCHGLRKRLSWSACRVLYCCN